MKFLAFGISACPLTVFPYINGQPNLFVVGDNTKVP